MIWNPDLITWRERAEPEYRWRWQKNKPWRSWWRRIWFLRISQKWNFFIFLCGFWEKWTTKNERLKLKRKRWDWLGGIIELKLFKNVGKVWSFVYGWEFQLPTCYSWHCSDLTHKNKIVVCHMQSSKIVAEMIFLKSASYDLNWFKSF